MGGKLYKLIGTGLNLVGLVMPQTAGDIAFDLFNRTDSPEPKSDKERELYRSSLSSMAEAKVDMLKAGGVDVATFVFPPKGAGTGRKILVIHGWGSRIHYLQNLITPLRDRATVVGLDLPGHGLSGGRRLSVLSAQDAIHAAWERHGPFEVIVGHSFGGYNAVMAARGGLMNRPALKPQKLVIIGAPAKADDMFVFFGQSLGLSKTVQTRLEKSVEIKSGKPVSYFSGARMLGEINIPTLVLHAEDDKEVPASDARLYGSSGPHVTLEWLNGLGHRRIVNSATTTDRILNFLG